MEEKTRRTLKQVEDDPIFQALNPEGKEFMQVRFLPGRLNPFLASHSIEVVALIPFGLFPHIKTIPTWQMMLEDFKNGLYKNKQTIVVPSSGNTVHAVARLAKTFGFTKVKAVMSTDVPDSKSGMLRAFGLPVNIMQVADVAGTALEEAEKPGHYHLNQYAHPGNVRAHELYTGPEIVRALGSDVSKIGVVAVAMGSGGTACGVGRFFREANKKTTILGVRPTLGEQVPGARDKKRMEEVVTFPWEDVVHDVVEVGRKESFIGTRQLWSAVEPQPGPTSGLAWKGLMQYLGDLTPTRLEALRGKYAGFICPDDGRFYSDIIKAELDPDQGI